MTGANVAGPSRRRLWTGLLLSPAAWAAMELVAYGLASSGCDSIAALRPEVLLHPRLAILLLGIVCATVSVTGVMLSWQNSRKLRAGDAGARNADASQMLATVGVVAGGIFTVGIVFLTMPSALPAACGHAIW